MPLPPPTTTAESLLGAEYEHRFTEVMFHSARYHKQADQVYLLFVALLTGATLVLTKAPTISPSSITEPMGLLYLLLLSAALGLVLMLPTAMMDSLFMIYLNGARLAAIEQLLNKAAQAEVLVWDARIVPFFFGPQFTRSQHWLKPQHVVAWWAAVLFCIVLATLGLLCWMLVPDAFLWFSGALIVVAGAYIYQWWRLQGKGLRLARVHVYRFSGATWAQTDEPERTWRFEHWTAFLTFLLGIAPLVGLTIQDGTLGLNSRVQFPLLTLPTVLLGDGLLLPLINYRIAKQLREHGILKVLRLYQRRWISLGIAAISTSMALNWLLHLGWRNDGYSGFMDVREGYLSLAGWWHLGFSTAQVALLICFFGLLLFTAINHQRQSFEYAFRTWMILFGFSLLSVADFTIRHAFIFHTPSLSIALRSDWKSLLPLLITGVATLLAYATFRIQSHRPS